MGGVPGNVSGVGEEGEGWVPGKKSGIMHMRTSNLSVINYSVTLLYIHLSKQNGLREINLYC